MHYRTPFQLLSLGAIVTGASARSTASPAISLLSTTATTASNASSMIQLSSDPDFHFELLRDLAAAPYGGSDIGEVLTIATQIIPSNFESYSSAFKKLADRVYNLGLTIDRKKNPISLRDTMFRAATYYRSADFYLHGNPNDPRINEYWYAQASAHDVAISLLPVPGKRINITTTSGFYVPAIYYKAPNCKGPRPTFIIGSGYDGQQEELYHQMVFPVLERGWNVITYEGPGQATPRRFQNLGFILEWEKVVTPVVDYLLSDKHQEVDAQAIALVGFSFGGFLAPRAAAFEHRLAALVAIDGVYDFGKTFNWGPITPYLGSGNETAFNAGIQYIHKTSNDTKIRWGIDQGLWAWNTESSYEWATAIKNFTLEGIVKNIKCPTFVGDAENDIFFTGQPQELADNLGSLATRHVFKTEDGEGEHCQLGAFRGLNQVVLDWFRGTVLDKVGK